MKIRSSPAPGPLRVISNATDVAVGPREPRLLTHPDGIDRRGLSILVAEDAPENRLLLKTYLRGSPHTITFADHGRQALELFMAGQFDLVLMDIQMPVMDGLEATRAIRAFESTEARPATPIIAITANARAKDIEISCLAGCDGHLSKPVSKRTLLEAIQRFEGQATDASTSREHATDIEVPEDMEELVVAYLESRRRDVDAGSVLLARGDFDGLATIGHNMKGTGSSYGFRLLTDLGASLEQSARVGDGRCCEQDLQTLHAYLTSVHLSTAR